MYTFNVHYVETGASYGIFFVTFDTMDRLEIENPGQRFN